MGFSSTMVWEVRNGGSDSTNGGGFRGGANLATPSAPTLATAPTGGSISAGTYYIVVTLNDGNGETPQSPQTAVTATGATTSTITVTAPTNPNSQGATWSIFLAIASGGPYVAQSTGLAFTANKTLTSSTSVGTQAPGVDYSQQSGVQFSLTTASTVHTTTTQVNVAVGDHTVTAADVGNIFNNTGGTATVQRLEITAIDLVNNRWTVDKAAGTAGQTMTGGLGGALATPGMAGGLTVGHLTFLKYNATPYSSSATGNVAGGSYAPGNGGERLVGYDTTRSRFNSDVNRPTIQAAANSMTVVSLNWNTQSASGVIVDGNGHTNVTGFDFSRPFLSSFYRCHALSCATGFGASSTNVQFLGCSASSCTTGFIIGSSSGAYACVASGCTTGFSIGAGTCFHCADTSAVTNHMGFNVIASSFALVNCTSYWSGSAGSGNNGFIVNASGPNGAFINCVAYGYSQVSNFGFWSGASTNPAYPWLVNSAGGNNATNHNGIAVSTPGFITLTADPFVNAAGNNFSLNNTAGGGPLLRAAGWPSSFPGLSTNNYIDVGMAQHAAMLVNSGISGGACG